ncbi:NAD dependent epimerase/dehydratase family protein [Chryseolinea serpens]|uniref:NAD dependent epimerase/dehydratase family protein n=1 Tax=Chryseolinea serpens TaxID=947013 RepID=A0A1M5R3T2_9BACT|nr:NAD(P)H-binding protein [Chryseolinea serpens]SHH21075.1 NAD dependent epimerase/dehydratase family protein [Chryseolinea serpens]
MKALVIGATGATGKDLVDILLHDADYTSVVIFVRAATQRSHPKLTEILTDFDNLDTVSPFVHGDVWFSCLGTTLKTAGSKDKQWHIDFEIPLKFAELAKRNGVLRAVLLSAYGAKASSPLFYSMVKGKLEDQIEALAFHQYIIFKPAMLLRKNTDRSGERVSAPLLNVLSGLGLFRKFKPLPTSVLAEKMAKAPKTLSTGLHIIMPDKIRDFR